MSRRSRNRRPQELPEVRQYINDGSGEFTGSFAHPTLSGVSVNEHTALTIAAVWQAVNIYANTVASLNLYVAERDRRGGHSPAYDHPVYDLVHCRPNKIITSFRWRQTAVSQLKTAGNSYSEILFDKEGNATELHLLDHRNVNPWLDEKGDLYYRLFREKIDLPAYKVLHFAGLGWDGLKGYSPIHMSRDVLGLAIAQNNYQSSLMGNNAQPTGYLKYPNKLKDDQQARLRESWNAVHQGTERSGSVGILTGGVEWVATSFSPVDQQLIAQNNWSVSQVARLYNLPQHMLNQMEGATFSNIEEQNIQFVQQSLTPLLVSIEQEMNWKLIKPEDRHEFTIRHDVRSLLRGNTAAQTAYNQSMFSMGALSINEIRLSEGDTPIDDAAGDWHFVATNNLTAVENMGKGKVMSALEDKQPDKQIDDPTDKPETDVANTALNGAQISSLLEIITQVATGLLPVESAKGLIAASFPTLGESQVGAILDSLEGFQPKTDAPLDAPDEPKTDTLDALRSLVLDPVGRMLRREIQAVKTASKKPEFRQWLQSYYPKHRDLVVESVSPALLALSKVEGRERDPGELANRLIEINRTLLDDLSTCCPEPELPQAIERLTSTWLDQRSQETEQWIKETS